MKPRWWLGAVALAVAWIASIGFLLGVGAWFFDAAKPPDDATKAQIVQAERLAWGNGAKSINRILVVQRGDYAAVATNIDFDNLALLRRSNGRWHRLTPNGWRYRVDKFAFYRAGVPILTANALANGIVHLWHAVGYISE